MDAREYNSATGRFTSPDLVPGGNENAYNYPDDPVNTVDLTGYRAEPAWVKTTVSILDGLAIALSVASWIVSLTTQVEVAAVLSVLGDVVSRISTVVQCVGGGWNMRCLNSFTYTVITIITDGIARSMARPFVSAVDSFVDNLKNGQTLFLLTAITRCVRGYIQERIC